MWIDWTIEVVEMISIFFSAGNLAFPVFVLTH